MRFMTVLVMLLAGSAARADHPAVVSLTFDDALVSVTKNALPLTEQYGLHGTAYLTTAFIGTPGHLNWGDAQKLRERGWEIGAHTHTHANLRSLGDEGIERELELSTRAFAEHGMQPTSFSSPLGEYDDRVMRAIMRRYASQRNAWGNNGINALPLTDPYHIVSLPLTSSMTAAYFDNVLDRLVDEGGWLVLQFHAIDDRVPSGPWAVSKATLQYVIQGIVRRHIAVLTVSEAQYYQSAAQSAVPHTEGRKEQHP